MKHFMKTWNEHKSSAFEKIQKQYDFVWYMKQFVTI